MYQDIKRPDAALTHLFFHCCFKDGAFTGSEIKSVSDKLVGTGLNAELNFKDEVIRYKAYRPSITDEAAYLEYLIQVIRPINEMALFSYCVELCLSDTAIGPGEESLLERIGKALDLDTAGQEVIKKLMVQRKVVESQKVF